jgi:hypothetical protein
MKILLHTDYRTGSKSLGEWLSFELGLTYYHELLNPKFKNMYLDVKLTDLDNCVVKISSGDEWNYEKQKTFFDKRIVLIREDTKSQAESLLWGDVHNKWHNTIINNKWDISYYKIDDKFLIDNKDKIDLIENSIKITNDYFKSLNECLLITYEELYYSSIGKEKISNYLTFTPKTNIANLQNKLRDGVKKMSLI